MSEKSCIFSQWCPVKDLHVVESRTSLDLENATGLVNKVNHKIIMFLKEWIFLSPFLRRVQASSHRVYASGERRDVYAYCLKHQSRDLIAINVPYIYFLEHVNDLRITLVNHATMAPFVVGPSNYPHREHKKALFEYYSSRYELEYGVNLFAFPWIREVDAKLLLEVAVSSYGCDSSIKRVIYTHGMAGLNFSKDLKQITRIQNHRAIFLNGPMQRRAILMAHKKYGGRLPDLFEIGSLRSDRLSAKKLSFDRAAYLKRLRLTDAPLLLFAPTWGWFTDLEEWLDNVVRLGVQEGLNIMLRLHPLATTGKKGVGLRSKIDRIMTCHENIRNVVSADLDELMLAADVMLTDVSGLGLEFMAIGKPTLFWPAPLYFKLYGEDRPEMWGRIGKEVNNYDDLRCRVFELIGNNECEHLERELRYNRGSTLPVMIDALQGLI